MKLPIFKNKLNHNEDKMSENKMNEKKISESKANKINEKKVMLSPSILSVPIDLVPAKIKKVEKEIDFIHIDVMDGKFVSNETNGVEMFEVAKNSSKKPLDVHLMVENPLEEIEKYEGASIITFHIEAVKTNILNNNHLDNNKINADFLINNFEVQLEKNVKEIIKKIRSTGAKVGMSIKPDTMVSELTNFLNDIDLVLIMTVEPGYGGQKLITDTLNKVVELRKLGYKNLIEVDGGVTVDNANEIRNISYENERGVDIIVAGTAIFNAENEIEVIKKIKGK